MRTRGIAAVVAAALTAASATIGAGSAWGQGPLTCTWGGTPVAATGVNKIAPPGISNTASTAPIHFHATGSLGGQCAGTVTFDGFMDTGATCSYITFSADVSGLPGVATVVGTAIAGIAPARLYDAAGNVVGSENAQFLSDPAIVSECMSSEGVTRNPFSSVIELFDGGI